MISAPFGGTSFGFSCPTSTPAFGQAPAAGSTGFGFGTQTATTSNAGGFGTSLIWRKIVTVL